MDQSEAHVRFWTKVEIKGKTQCWPWQGAVGKHGYGVFRLNDTTMTAHRAAAILVGKDVPAKHHADHQCHNIDRTCPGGHCKHRICVNPRHIEIVTNQVNVERSLARHQGGEGEQGKKTHCNHGHKYTPPNTYTTPKGHRMCRTCRAERQSLYKRRRAEAEGRVWKPHPSRRTHCLRGHPFDGENTRINARGVRICRACESARRKRRATASPAE